jgi:hypothetical protein
VPSSSAPLADLLADLARALGRLGVRWYLFGAQAATGLEVEFLSRVPELAVGSVPVPVASVDDLIVLKLLAGRPKDLDDVVAMLRVHGTGLDLGRIRRTLRIEDALGRLDLVAELERALLHGRGAG